MEHRGIIAATIVVVIINANQRTCIAFAKLAEQTGAALVSVMSALRAVDSSVRRASPEAGRSARVVCELWGDLLSTFYRQRVGFLPR